MDKYKQYIDTNWWRGIGKRELDNWINNFGDRRDIAKLVLNNVIFYNDEQLTSYTRFLFNKLKEQVYFEAMREKGYSYIDDIELSSRWEKYLNRTRFMPAALATDPTSSAHRVICKWRSTLGNDKYISVISEIYNGYKKGIRRFVLVDDFSGTGKQMEDVLRQIITFDGEEIEIGHLPEVADIEIIVAVYVIHEKAKKKLGDDYPNVYLLFTDIISEKFNYLDDNSLIYDKYNGNRAKEFVEALKDLIKKITKDEDKYIELSSYLLNIPVVFEHGCPNNTLILLFAKTDNWQQLFKRGMEK